MGRMANPWQLNCSWVYITLHFGVWLQLNWTVIAGRIWIDENLETEHARPLNYIIADEWNGTDHKNSLLEKASVADFLRKVSLSVKKKQNTVHIVQFPYTVWNVINMGI